MIGLPITQDGELKMCSQNDGIELCNILRDALAPLGIFPALTGGLLYKNGLRKDIDIVLYRHRQQVEQFETTNIKDQLQKAGVEIIEFYGFVTKAKWNGFTVDLFNPETKEMLDGGDY
jgi:hypothetical protein